MTIGPMINSIEATYRELRRQGREVLKLFSGNPCDEGFIFPPEILKKSYNSYFDKQTYQPQAKGLLKAREAIVHYYAKQDIKVNPEHILLTSGTSESFFYLFSLLTKPGDNVLTPNPAYPLFDYIAQLAHIKLRHYPLLEEKNWAVDVEALKKQADKRTKAIVLISPNNPTGSVISPEQIQEIVSWANSKNIPLICDEVFSEFYFFPSPRPSILLRTLCEFAAQPSKTGSCGSRGEGGRGSNLCFTLNGISKMFALPSMKLGWIVVTGEKDRVEKMVDHLETTADTFLSCHTAIQEALPLLFQEGWNFVESYKREVGERRNLAIEILKKSSKINFVEPKGAFYLMMKIEGSSEEKFVIDLMKQTGVFIHPGYFYDYEKGIHGVISFLCEREKLKMGLERLLEFIKK